MQISPLLKKCRWWGNTWGRLEVVAVKINDPVFLDSTQEKLTHTIYKLVANTDFCVSNQTDISFSFIL